MNRVLGKASERYRTIPGQEVIASGLGVSFPGSGQIFERTSDPAGLPAVADGNRGAILTDIAIDYGGRTWALGLKGVGARVGMYQAEWGDPGGLHLRAEAWFGDSPWGGQGDVNASRGLEITALAPLGHWNGFHICPVIEAVEFPAEHVAVAQSHFWYRRYHGKFLQEHRLMPSNVRLFHQGERTLGQHLDVVLQAFEIDDEAALEAFVARVIETGVAAATLYARSLREGVEGLEGLIYSDVWLDKDSVVAPDGTLCFADLEGLEWEGGSFERRVRNEFDRNWYELMFAIDALLHAGERRTGRPRTQRERRLAAMARLDLALQEDPFVRPERTSVGLDFVVSSPLLPKNTVRLHVIEA